MAVHSTQLGAHATVGADTTLYTVPAGKRTIWKHALIRNAGTAQTCAFVLHLGGGVTVNFWFPLAATPAAGSTIQIAPWVVLNAGDSIHFASGSSQTADVIISGAELTV